MDELHHTEDGLAVERELLRRVAGELDSLGSLSEDLGAHAATAAASSPAAIQQHDYITQALTELAGLLRSVGGSLAPDDDGAAGNPAGEIDAARTAVLLGDVKLGALRDRLAGHTGESEASTGEAEFFD